MFQKIQFEGKNSDYFWVALLGFIKCLCTFGLEIPHYKNKRFAYLCKNIALDKQYLCYDHTNVFYLNVVREIVYILLVSAIVLLLMELYFYAFGLLAVLLFLLPWHINDVNSRFAENLTLCSMNFNWSSNYWVTGCYLVLIPALGILSVVMLPVAMEYTYVHYLGKYLDGTDFHLIVMPLVALLIIVFVPISMKYACEYYVSKFSWNSGRLATQIPLINLYTYFACTILFIAICIFALFALLVWGSGEVPSGRYSAIKWLFILQILCIVGAIIAYRMTVFYCKLLALRALTFREEVIINSEVKLLRFSWINLSNALCACLSFGLLAPWGTCRRYTYLSSSLSFRASLLH